MHTLWWARNFFDAKLLLAIVVLSVPFAVAVARRIFGSLGGLWDAWRSTWRTPAEIAEDTTRDVLFPAGASYRPFRGDERIWYFSVGYALAVLAAYSIVHEHLPGLARVLSGW